MRASRRRLLALGVALGALAAPLRAADAPRSRVTYDHYSILIDGKRTMVWSAEFHPFRLPSPSLWRDVLQKMKASGFNTVSLYFDWGYHTSQPGRYDFHGIRDIDRVLDMARDEGLYVITRAGPYVNAELARGGFPGWLTRQAAQARTDAPEYLAAADEWMTQIDRIIARHQIDTGKGTVILHQIENELSATNPTQQRYMRHLYDKARADGITVPIFHNDPGRQGRWVPPGADVPGTVEGPNDLYAFDGYPGGTCDVHNQPTSGTPAPDWGLWGPGGAQGGSSASPHTPGFLAEFGGGWFDYWGSNGLYPCNAIQRGKGYQRVFYGTNIANGIAIQNFYMGYGGTSWGWMPAPVVYTSYDYGAAIAEDRTVRPKALELKQLGEFVQAVPDLAQLDKGAPVTMSSPAVRVYRDVNPATHAQLLFVTHQPSNARGDDAFTITADLPDGQYRLPQEGEMRLDGLDAKLLVAGVDLERQRLVYSTSELQTALRRGAEDIALLYGRSGEPGETVLRYASAPKVTVIDGAVRSIWDEARHDLRLDYAHRGLARVRIEGGGRAPLLLLIGDEAEAQRFFRQDATLERGPSLVRTARASGGTLALTGDTAGAEPLEVWGPATLRRVNWNGAAVPVMPSPSGSLVATRPLPAPRAFSLPDLTQATWRYAEDIPEARPDFDDSAWAEAAHAPDRSTIKAPTGQPTLQMDAYGFHQGDVWYRGRFHGSPDARRITLHYGGGGAGMLQLWMDGHFLGEHELPAGLASPVTTGVAEFTLPPEAESGDHLLSVMVRNDGNNWDLLVDDAHKEPRGLISVSLDRPGGMSFAVPVSWKIQGTKGGEALADWARGPLNNGGLHGEREGWTLPGFPDSGWATRKVPDATPVTGTSWYRSGFDLAVPAGEDATIGVQIGDPSTPRSPGRYRVLIFVNGWNMGQFIANIGPQRVFPIPEGILHHRGHNTLALAVTSDGRPGNGLEAVKLVTMRHVRGGVPVEPVAAPDYKALFP
ncbi:beta-galactosidase [Sphingomonas oligoaromativorans]|uniref:beta-galactosidase n=1 Tax=Sphingomonas oligoaromativorans TaxID=575322 RepID=UPI0014241DCD|nr:beta-galactosidase [Sphingomonas oligoaromativorans]NIJ31653.1 beta-galactosidase GanA [Sphingomonas oligoaromativorans]